MTTRRGLPRQLAVLAVVPALLVGAAGTAVAEDPLAGLSATERAEARSVVADAPTDLAPTVLVTSRTSPEGAPRYATVATTGRTDALAEVAEALGDPDTVAVEMVQTARTAANANDTYRSKQWGLSALGVETNGWTYSKGAGVTVAVVDTGVWTTHSDLKARIVTGRDFVDPGTAPTDANGHGTHVAGIIAATSNNRKWVASVAPSASIMPVRVLDGSGTGTTDDVAAGITWATDRGAEVVNLSLTMSADSPAVAAAVAYAQSRNVVVVAAAGNRACPTSGTNATTYPAAYDGVIGVGALSSSTSTASFSSCGSWVDVMAPGQSIVSTMIKNPRVSGCAKSRYWCSVSGTSMAAPFVAGAAALRIARTGVTRYDAATVTSQVSTSTIDLGVAGRDARTGAGRIDLKRLLTR